MLCPNCGTKTTTEHKFCRNCGMNLEPVLRALAAHLSVGGATAAQVARESERHALRRMANGMIAGIIVILFGVLLMTFLPGKAFKFLGVASAIIGVVATLMSVLSPLRSMGNVGAEPLPPALDATTPTTGRLLREQTYEPVPTSITDHTTELLNVEIKDRKPRN